MLARLISIKPGLITTNMPKNPTRTAVHLLYPTFSLSKKGESAVVTSGATNAKVNALAIEITEIE